MIAAACAHCGAEFKAYPIALQRGRKYCSYKCYWEAARKHPEPVQPEGGCVCDSCGKRFKLTRRCVGKYCSRKCRWEGRPLADRFKFTASDTGCWIWDGKKLRAGYGVITFRGRSFHAHRYSWEHHRGPIPDGLWVLHKCDNPSCVNPEHLFLGTVKDNVADMISKGRAAWQKAAAL